MRLSLNKLILHNFLSYGHSEIELNDRGYCLVSGVNRCSKDNALSNGSGKSSWSSGICWALTGETTQGLKSGIKNIYADKNEDCYVTLIFKVDNDEYEITRYREGRSGSDLKIKLNGQDISGKGIKESELVLGQYLPDLTSELIGSVIILGQGLPYKFTGNKPSGRKEVLEKLSKSDFMIEDIKNRITQRLNKLNLDLRTVLDNLLSFKSKKSVYDNQIESLKKTREDLLLPKDFDKNIKEFEVIIEKCNIKLRGYNDKITSDNEELEKVEIDLVELKGNKAKATMTISKKYQATIDETKELIFSIQAEIKSVKQEISNIEAIKDVCPTCGRPFEGVKKPDPTPLKEKLTELNSKYVETSETLKTINEKMSNETQEVEKDYDDKITGLEVRRNNLRTEINTLQVYVGQLNTKIRNYESSKAREEANKENHTKNLEKVENDIKTTSEKVEDINTKIISSQNEEEELNSRLEIVNKMKTLVQRDFRGFLLSNVIDFINKKAKEYSLDIFGTDNLDFILDGNEINISYCDKSFENLSGGEKQKVDLIVQFAIRDMMSQYLDFRANVLVLDEITDNLDSIGCSNVLNLISKKLNDIESVFIISHHADELSLPYDSEMVVVKNEEGISSIQ